MSGLSLDRARLHERYRAGELTAEAVIEQVYDRIEARGDDHVWITLVPRAEALAAARTLKDVGSPDSLPLYGLPFAVKDNIDVLGLPTTMAFPAAAYAPGATATVVRKALDAGAILIGKTNLDQFATGLNGTRSPYGVPVNPLNSELIPGGSSSGSAVAVSAGLVSFALGTDTAGSGRVPAALNNVVGIKPTPGLASIAGIVPACRSIDCPSIFALTVADGAAVLRQIAGYDSDSRSYPFPPLGPTDAVSLGGLRLGVPGPADVDFYGDAELEKAFDDLLARLQSAGATLEPLPMSEFYAAGELLYGGAWLAERHAAIATIAGSAWDQLDTAVRDSVAPGAQVSGAQVFADQERLAELRRRTDGLLDGIDALITPTVATTFTIEQIHDDPVDRNAVLGRLTTFTNLLGHAAVAVPAGFAGDGRPIGVTVNGTSGTDQRMLAIAAAIEATADFAMGATGLPRPAPSAEPAVQPEGSAADSASGVALEEELLLAVVGAHLSGMPLNGDLTRLGAQLESITTTAPCYRLHALPDTSPPKPGLRRVPPELGSTIEVEVYRLSAAGLGSFLTTVRAPLAIGSVELIDGRTVHGFVCEPPALEHAADISDYGGWRAFLAATS